jgi:hypothetical protein
VPAHRFDSEAAPGTAIRSRPRPTRSYATTPADGAALQTAASHCHPDAERRLPDFVRERSHRAQTRARHDASEGADRHRVALGSDSSGRHLHRRLRSLLATCQAMSGSSTIGTEGLFPRAQWPTGSREAGLSATSSCDQWGRDASCASSRFESMRWACHTRRVKQPRTAGEESRLSVTKS